ncbi:MAG: ribosomal protein bL36 [Candidatus Hodgkinia cicadicola]
MLINIIWTKYPPCAVIATVVKVLNINDSRRMKVKTSLRNLKQRHEANKIVKRGTKVFVINKINHRFKARQK